MRASHSAAALIIGGGAAGSSSILEGLKRPQSAGGPTPRRSQSALQFKPSALLKLEFRFSSGGHGLSWHGLIISEVRGQAKTLGVMPGWKLFSIDGNLVKDSQDAWSRLQEAQWQWRTTAVTFVTDFRAIRVEEHMIRAEEEKTE
ncbi:unnamed protein product, partial [Polarella glacialis]